jgi:hypothetical protein
VIGFLKSPNYPHWVELARAENVLQIYAETDEDRDPLDVSILPANEALIWLRLG